MAAKTTTRQHAKFLDPTLQVGSSIRYRFSVSESEHKNPTGTVIVSACADGEVSLTDCHRTINWQGYGKSTFTDMRDKIKAAVEVLNKALEDLDYLEGVYSNIKVTKGEDNDW